MLLENATQTRCHLPTDRFPNELMNYLTNYCKSYFVQFGQTRIFLIAVYDHSKAATEQLEKSPSGFSHWYQSKGTLDSIWKASNRLIMQPQARPLTGRGLPHSGFLRHLFDLIESKIDAECGHLETRPFNVWKGMCSSWRESEWQTSNLICRSIATFPT
jgi:hypothetical protein